MPYHWRRTSPVAHFAMKATGRACYIGLPIFDVIFIFRDVAVLTYSLRLTLILTGVTFARAVPKCLHSISPPLPAEFIYSPTPAPLSDEASRSTTFMPSSSPPSSAACRKSWSRRRASDLFNELYRYAGEAGFARPARAQTGRACFSGITDTITLPLDATADAKRKFYFARTLSAFQPPPMPPVRQVNARREKAGQAALAAIAGIAHATPAGDGLLPTLPPQLADFDAR